MYASLCEEADEFRLHARLQLLKSSCDSATQLRDPALSLCDDFRVRRLTIGSRLLARRVRVPPRKTTVGPHAVLPP